MKSIFSFLAALLLAMGAGAQTTTVSSTRAIVRDSIRIAGKWVRGINTDTSLAAAKNNQIPSTLAVKGYIDRRFNAVGVSPTAAGIAGALQLRGTSGTFAADSSVLFDVSNKSLLLSKLPAQTGYDFIAKRPWFAGGAYFANGGVWNGPSITTQGSISTLSSLKFISPFNGELGFHIENDGRFRVGNSSRALFMGDGVAFNDFGGKFSIGNPLGAAYPSSEAAVVYGNTTIDGRLRINAERDNGTVRVLTYDTATKTISYRDYPDSAGGGGGGVGPAGPQGPQGIPGPQGPAGTGSGTSSPPTYTTDLSSAQRKGDILYNVLDAATAEDVTYRKVTKWLDGVTITSANKAKYIDGVLYVELAGEYFRRTLRDGIVNAAWWGVYADLEGRTHNNDTPFVRLQKAIGKGNGLTIHMNQEGTYYFAKPVILRGAKYSLVGNPRGRVEFWNGTIGFVVESEMDIYNIKQYGTGGTFSPKTYAVGWAVRAAARIHNIGANRNGGEGVEIYGDISQSARNFNITTNATLYNGYYMYARLSSDHNIWIAGNLGSYSPGNMSILTYSASLDAGIESYTGTWDLFYTVSPSDYDLYENYFPLGTTATPSTVNFNFTNNASFAQILGGEIGYNARSGVRVVGADANSIKLSNLDLRLNGEWGVKDNSFLGIFVDFCMGHGNYFGHYTTTDPNAKSVYTGCYGESQINIFSGVGQMPNVFTDLTTISGGMFENGIVGGGYRAGTSMNKLNVGSYQWSNNSFQRQGPAGQIFEEKKIEGVHSGAHYRTAFGNVTTNLNISELVGEGGVLNEGLEGDQRYVNAAQNFNRLYVNAGRVMVNERPLQFGAGDGEGYRGDITFNKNYNGKNAQSWVCIRGGGGTYSEGRTVVSHQWAGNIRWNLSGNTALVPGSYLEDATGSSKKIISVANNSPGSTDVYLMLEPNAGPPAGGAILIPQAEWKAQGVGRGLSSERPMDLQSYDRGLIYYETDTRLESVWTGTAWELLGGNLAVYNSDANYTLTAPVVKLKAALTANRTITMPTAVEGMKKTIYNFNTTGFNWITSLPIRKLDGSTVTQLSNKAVYKLAAVDGEWVLESESIQEPL